MVDKKTTEYPFLLKVSRNEVNDDALTLVEWVAGHGSSVKVGDVLCNFESSKAVFEVVADADGFLFRLAEVPEKLQVGHLYGYIHDKPEPVSDLKRKQAESRDTREVPVARKAMRLIESHGLSLDLFRGLSFVREQDVLSFLEGQGAVADYEDRPLSTIQQRAADVVTRSSREIPHSYLQVFLPAEPVERYLEGLSQREDMMVTVSDLLVASVASVAGSFPKCNASFRGNELRVFKNVNVGFALNLATGDLVVPVLRQANRMSLAEIVIKIRDFQKRACQKKLKAEDFSDGTVTVTSLIGSGIHSVFPIIYPEQTAIIAVSEGPSSWSSYVLTLGFDHRALNGMEAAEFLAAVGEKARSWERRDTVCASK